jgi:ribosomal protein L11 methyltransferase
MLEGLPPTNATHVMRLLCDEAAARRIADIIVETFDPAEAAAAAFEHGARRDWKAVPWTVEAYFREAPDEAALRALVVCAAGEEAGAALEFGEIATADWVAASLAGLPAVRAGRILLHGRHNRDAVKAYDLGIEIEAALAFGSGHHGSTRGCLLMLDRLARRRHPRSILDIGTGTGVLAIAAAKLFRVPVDASDIDSVAVAAARANARLNGAARFVRPVIASGLRHPEFDAASYDLVLANILARPLRQLAPAIRRVLAPGGEIILSGLLDCDVASVLSAYGSQGLALANRLDLDGWASLHLRRGRLAKGA